MNRTKAIEARVSRLLRELMALEVEGPETDLVDAHLLDSLALVTMLQHLEREFGVRVGPDDLEIEHFRSIARIARFVERRMDPAAAQKQESEDGFGSSVP